MFRKAIGQFEKNQLMQIADKKNSKYIKEKLRLCQHNAKHSLFPLGLKHCFSSDKQVRGQFCKTIGAVEAGGRWRLVRHRLLICNENHAVRAVFPFALCRCCSPPPIHSLTSSPPPSSRLFSFFFSPAVNNIDFHIAR